MNVLNERIPTGGIQVKVGWFWREGKSALRSPFHTALTGPTFLHYMLALAPPAVKD